MNQITLPNLLILDDEEEIAGILGDLARQCGFEVTITHEAGVFFEKLNEKTQYIILDLMIPDVDGVDVLRMLSGKKFSVSVILISGADRRVLQSAEALAIQYGLKISGVLEKPIRIREYQKLLTGLLSEQKNESTHSFTAGNRAAHEQTSVIGPEEIEQGIRENQFVLFYQPKINFKTGTVSGFESLVRWSHPKRGLVFPDAFIPTLESYPSLMDAMTEKLILQALAQCSIWNKQFPGIAVAVNVSPVSMNKLILPETIAKMIENFGLKNNQLIVEVTETQLLENMTSTLDILTRIRIRGIGLSVDDFGIGYSSLKQIHRYPFTELKIDRSFVSVAPYDKEALFICQAAIDLGHKLGMTVVAEGIETAEVGELMKQQGCDKGQGYFYSKPMPANTTLQFLAGFKP
ncbi:EAL domain-containing response regulator [Leptospira noguchii]|uniref:EAL domain-containing response regulator n=2 Tax=Leptospira noguchii TaxID=28182 RepID=A0A9Q8RJP5_9LEPT|nr:EAL domain-containing response regulator [Leptospira noguchii]EKR74605.1 cyclic diguanylate phosphodiesterase (EAL) domain protein [Leptospira noguchii str. 2006001870]EMI63064.1 cyclic diguanylate phosphodiesterase (EAL) domain protein [Leptospira noguchii str. Bonito]EMN00950.1 cyclic diguanylate phosphodiesterase (EAL) domain protein [Leptospira noguchii str. 2007001578]EPE85892.1 cyclic diguanylate phosphodiesterase (EAL) domain protein [Leptospira noguchii str. 1993005606]TQE78106.1 EA